MRIEYYFDGKRKRERIGPSKSAAEQRLREVLKARTENRYIQKDFSAKTTLGELCNPTTILNVLWQVLSYVFVYAIGRHDGSGSGSKRPVRSLSPSYAFLWEAVPLIGL